MKFDSEEVAALVVSLLSDELRWERWRGNDNAVAGHCYTASEVCRALLGPAWEPFVVTHECSFHWFLRHRDSGEILDPTAAQFRRLPSYEKARPGRFGLRMSAASEVLLWRVLSQFGAGLRQEAYLEDAAGPSSEGRPRARTAQGNADRS